MFMYLQCALFAFTGVSLRQSHNYYEPLYYILSSLALRNVYGAAYTYLYHQVLLKSGFYWINKTIDRYISIFYVVAYNLRLGIYNMTSKYKLTQHIGQGANNNGLFIIFLSLYEEKHTRLLVL